MPHFKILWGDYAVLVGSALLTLSLFPLFWSQQQANQVRVTQEGKVVAFLDLNHDQTITLQGALGPAVVEVKNKQVRVAKDNSPRQICVKQGWLSKAGQTAICLPNKITLELLGQGGTSEYDGVAY